MENKDWIEKFYKRFEIAVTNNEDETSTLFLNVLPEDIQSFISFLLSERDKELREIIEGKFGKKGTMNGSFGYQGIVMDIQAFQTEIDQVRDKILDILEKR